jgi:hypothetical protein
MIDDDDDRHELFPEAFVDENGTKHWFPGMARDDDEKPKCRPDPKPRRNVMHYKNGREAKNGDKVVLIDNYGTAIVGILYDATAGNDHCNGKLAVFHPNDRCPDLKDCLHLDDVKMAIKNGLPSSGGFAVPPKP